MPNFRFSSLLALIVLFIVPVSWSQQPVLRHAPNALPGVEPQMLTAEYWIALQKDADTVIMSPDEIARFNEKIRNKKVDPAEYEGVLRNTILPLDMPATLPGDNLRVRLASNQDKLFNPPDLYGSKTFFDGRNAPYTDAMKQDIADRMNMDGIPKVITRRFGIVVNHSSVRQYPTSVPGYHDTKVELDRFQLTDLCIGNPVAVLHETVDGDFLFVESPISLGWILADNIALADRDKIRELTGDKNFVMACADKVPVYGDPGFKNFARYFYFSATLPLIGRSDSGYVVKMPYRQPDGALGVAKGYIKPSADVNVGYLPYTKRNVLTQAFKLLNTPYGWHGQDDKRDCVGFLRVLFGCFGIQTGRSMRDGSENRTSIDPKLTMQEKIAKVSSIEPVITVASGPGHYVLYLGKAHNGMLYFMHQGGFGYKDENGEQVIVNRISLNPVTHAWFSIDNTDMFTVIKNTR